VTVRQLLSAMLHEGVLAGAAVWALSAAVAPRLIAARRSAPMRVALSVLWAGATIAATVIAMRALAGESTGAPRGAILGAVLGGMILAAPMPARRGQPTGLAEVVP
jgi:hypothetical protein